MLFNQFKSCFPWSHGLQSKKLQGSVALVHAPIWVPTQRPFAPSVASVMLVTNGKSDNEMIPGLCTDLLAFALWLMKTLENLS